ncbi:MAG TPA: cyclic nucleotide-binding domain-containing protein [Rhodocyclaceae bacterium]|nr:cyclic nucleotide-binding domain-containing protein [Rhodocyclaceae bacterium]
MRLPSFHRPLSERLARLKQLPLFATLNTRELRIVEGLLHQREYLAGEVIFDEGEDGQAIYFIFEGRVLICRQGQPVDGFIVELGEGTLLGEQALLDHVPRAAQARAATACKMGVLFRAEFENLLKTDARIASKVSLQLARYLSRRLRESVMRTDEVHL